MALSVPVIVQASVPVVVLAVITPADSAIWSYFASVSMPEEGLVRRLLEELDDEVRSTAALEPLVDLRRTRLEMVLKVLDVDGAVRRVSGGWVSTGVPWSYDKERYDGLREAREREGAAMREYLHTSRCLLRFLREQLDDPEAADCGRCSRCLGSRWAAPLRSLARSKRSSFSDSSTQSTALSTDWCS